jgi:hypothetical protein
MPLQWSVDLHRCGVLAATAALEAARGVCDEEKHRLLDAMGDADVVEGLAPSLSDLNSAVSGLELR